MYDCSLSHIAWNVGNRNACDVESREVVRKPAIPHNATQTSPNEIAFTQFFVKK